MRAASGRGQHTGLEVTTFIEHSDDWSWQPSIPARLYRGWYISNDDGEPMDGPYPTREALDERLEEIADDYADIGYNRMMKSEQANAMFDMAQMYRRLISNDAASGSVESAAPGFGISESRIGRS